MNQELKTFIDNNKQFNWQPTLPLPNNLWATNWPWVPIIHDIDLTTVVNEMKQVDQFFVPHRANDKINSYGHDGWCALTLHGIDFDKTEHFDRYGYKSQEEANFHWTSVCNLIPESLKLIKQLPFKNYGRVRIMRLSPGGYVMPHRDGNGRIFGPFNYALTNPEGCEFVFENYGVVPFKPGRGFMLDIGNRHCVVNNSNEYRYHVIVHGEPLNTINEYFKQSINLL